MKKITVNVILGLAMLLSYAAKAQFTQNFDAGTTTPAGWSVINNGDVGTWQFTTPGTGIAHSGTNVAFLAYDADVAHEDYLVTPAVTVTAGVSDHLGFWAKQRSDFYSEPFDVLLSTTNANAASFTTVIASAVTPSEAAWTEYSYSLSAYVGQTVYIAFKSTTLNQWQLYLDDVTVDAIAGSVPNCAANVSPLDGATNVTPGDITFAWTPSATGDAATSYDLYYGLTAGNATILVGNYTTTSATITVTGFNATFYWKIVPKNSAGSATGCAEWSFTTSPPPPVPANDSCATATGITSLPYTNTLDATSATNNGGFIAACTDLTGMNDGVWYTVVGTGADLRVSVSNVVGWDPEVGVYTGDCSSFTCVGSADGGGASGDESFDILGSVLGTTYYINVGYYSGDTDMPEGPFTITVSAIDNTPPANDDFANAVAISGGSNYTGDTTNATLDQGDAPGGFGADVDAPNVWYSYTGTGTAQTVTLNLCGSGYDTSVLVYTGTAGALTIVAGNDDDAACGAFPASVRSRVSFTSDGTSTYYIAIEGFDPTSVGTYTMDVTCANVTPPAVANQNCGTALGVLVNNSDISSDNSFGDVSPVQPACDTFGSIQDVWFSFQAPSSAVDVTLTSGTMTSANLSIYSGACGSLNSLGCAQNLTAPYVASLTGLTPNDTYYVQVWSNFAEQGTFTLRLNDASLAVSNFDSANFRAYPNPVKGILNLSYDKTISNVSVFNLLGQEVITKAINANLSQIDMSPLSAGTFLVKVTADNQVKTIKIVKE